MKSSRYNFLFSVEEEKFIGFNSFTSALFEANKKEALKIREILKSPKLYTRDKMFKMLYDAGFIIDDRDDELDFLEKSYREGKGNNEFLSLTIAPTLNCNFKCDYCYEACPNSRMDEKVKNRLIELVTEKAPNLRELSISWFGGEPLLAMNTIRELSIKLIKICRENKIKYDSSITTNGYLLNFDMARELKGLLINSAQVTIDGPPEIHDQRRPSKDGRSSFRAIVDNLKEVAGYIDVSIRINLDKRNISHIPRLLDILHQEGLLPETYFYFGHVKAINGDREIASYCLNNEEYAVAIKNLYKIAMEKGYSEPIYPEVVLGGFCGACSRDAIVVDPIGKVFKCWADIGSTDENTIGDIFREDYVLGLSPEEKCKCTRNHERYLSWEPFTNDECRNCKTLPLCMGGCPVQGIKDNKSNSCTHWKYNLKDILYLHYQNKTRKKKER